MGDNDAFGETVAADDSDGLASTIGDAGGSAERAHEPAPIGAARFATGDEIGRGGMGIVLSATDRQFNREVAVKRLRPDVSDAANVERFAAECLITGNLSHPGIPAVYERGDLDGVPFYAMQRVKGRTMAELLQAAATLEQRLALVPALGRVAQTLAYAHSNGVIHRDIKPSNVVIGDYGETFVLDWGIAKVRGGASEAVTGRRSGPVDSSATRAGQVVGTPAYMAPEQASGRIDAIDERTDVFALGALLYHVLTGHSPYHAVSATEAIERARRGEFVSIHQAAPKAPKALRLICERAMAVQASDRFRSAAEIATALERFTSDAVAHQDTGPVGWIARAITVATALLAATAVGGVAMAAQTFREAGGGAILIAVLATAGLVLAILDYVTRGAYRLSPFVLALAGCTFVAGVFATIVDLDMVYRTALGSIEDVKRLRFVLVEGTREASGAVAIGSLLTGAQLLVWAIARRRAAR